MKKNYKYIDFIIDGIYVRGYFSIVSLIVISIITFFTFLTKGCNNEERKLIEIRAKDTLLVKPPTSPSMIK